MTKKYNKNKDKEIVDNGNIIFKLQHSRKLIKVNQNTKQVKRAVESRNAKLKNRIILTSFGSSQKYILRLAE